MVCGVLFGCAPAWQAARQNTSETLKEGGRVIGGGRHRLRLALVVVEFGLALTLLVGRRPGHPQPDQDGERRSRVQDRAPADLLAARSARAADRQPSGHHVLQQLLARVQAVPGVVSASVSTGMPVNGTGFGMPFTIVGQAREGSVEAARRRVQHGDARLLQDVRHPHGRGRAFTEQDRAGSVPVAIVNDVVREAGISRAWIR